MSFFQTTRYNKMNFYHYFPVMLQPLLFFFVTVTVLHLIKISTKAKKENIITINSPPGSCGLPYIGETLAFIKASNSSKGFYDFVQKRRDWYGNCFKTKIFGQVHVFILSINTAKAILGNESANFSKRYMKSIAELLGEHSLLCASHTKHKIIRSRISNLFTFDSMMTTIEMFDRQTVETLHGWKQEENVSVIYHTLKMTFRAICKMLMSLEEEEDELEMLQRDVFEVTEAMLAFPVKFPMTRFYRGLKARRRIMKLIKRKIALRRRGLENHDDFLQSFISNDPSEDPSIMDNILTLIIAGQITTSSAIAWMVKYLDENQEVQNKLRAIQLKQTTCSENSSLGIEALNEMSYAAKIVKESLRMATIVSWFPRVALDDFQIEGFHIKKGWVVNIDARAIHYNPDVYKEPLNFNPSRFDEDPISYSYLAFGVGGRTCLGMNLAKYMMLIFLHRLVTTYRWKVTDPDSSLEKWALFPRLRSGCPIRVFPLKDDDTQRN